MSKTIQDTTFWLLGATLFKIRDQVSRLAKKHNLTEKHVRILCALVPNHSQSISSLCAQVGCDAPSATAVIDRLERSESIQRQNDSFDRRVTTIALTRKGVKLRQILLDEITTTESEQMKALNNEELNSLREYLVKLIE